ncbi:MAG TPA: hypothetical protein VLF18_02755 [Tahibacter sp.]|uniref:hypothetical protein n=1 Tax=Tahibacter sp. TaxID=2056211 RepID=UPI002BEB0D1F|nr:hypothetical protein [Tahibacter sp.]HSX59098.1 hypothetical protein [Tahibacter sp.]
MFKRRAGALACAQTTLGRYAGLGGLALVCSFSAAAQQTDIAGPTGSGKFGASVVFLENGNFVVTDPGFDEGAADIGAVYLYRGNGELVSRLTGSAANDRVGSGRLVALPGGNAVVCSPDWDNGAIVDSGAATWIDGSSGISGVVSPANSLVSDVAGSRVCSGPFLEEIAVLTNGNYVVASMSWAGMGAVTWGHRSSGVRGVIGSGNSLTGSTPGDFTERMVVPLTNGNYVVVASGWDGPGMPDTGAVVLGDGEHGTRGVISLQNALVGGVSNTSGGPLVTPLRNGNYVAIFPGWRQDAAFGAIVWNSGTTARSGAVTLDMALTGASLYAVSGVSILALANGNYLVMAPGAHGIRRGALTWGDGTTGTTGVISPANSIVGAHDLDELGDSFGSSAALANGNYVVCNDRIDSAEVADIGACVWGDGSRPTSAVISPANAMFGSDSVVALSNGHYVVSGGTLSDGVGMGAVAWGNGLVGTVGRLSPANAFLGSDSGSRAVPLDNGKYVMLTVGWDDGANVDVGAVTVLDGSGPSVGRVTAMNSLVGSSYGDNVGFFALALEHGRFVTTTPNFSLPPPDFGVGAVVWADTNRPVVGRVTPQNALHGTYNGQWLGALTPLLLPNGDFITMTPTTSPWGPRGWSFGRGRSPMSGPVNAGNTVVGGGVVSQSYDVGSDTLLVGRQSVNKVTLLRPDLLFSVRGD